LTTFDPRLLTPPQEKEEVYPYRPVWRSIVVENGLLLALAILLLVLVTVLHVQIPQKFWIGIGVLLALAPLIFWLVFSWWPERFAPQPRMRLLPVVIIGALAANAVGIPLINQFFQVDRWLPLSSAAARIVGYMFTVGIVQEVIKYLVVRYVVWPDLFRVRLDGVAYAVACAVGYATIVNVDYVFSSSASPDAVALRVFSTMALHTATALILGFGFAELCFGFPSAFLMMLMVALCALLTGIFLPVRAGLINAPFALGVSATRPLLGLGFSVVVLAGVLFVFSFLFAQAERQAREAIRGEM
jgi:RsiW-degrading membrane proteinase PrsW (M82 family)